MPYVDPSWRMYPQWRWASRMLCRFGLHHWMRSKSLNANIVCAVCSKRTPQYWEYKKKFEGSKEPKNDSESGLKGR